METQCSVHKAGKVLQRERKSIHPHTVISRSETKQVGSKHGQQQHTIFLSPLFIIFVIPLNKSFYNFLNNRLIFLTMCLAIPGKIIEIEGDKAKVDFGEGNIYKANVSLIDAKVGKWVLVHAGYAIQVMEEEEAEATLSLFDELLGIE